MNAALNRITIDPEICHGKPCVRSLRYPVDVMLEHLAAGDTAEDLMAEFPDLVKEDILACIAYGAAAVQLRETELVTA